MMILCRTFRVLALLTAAAFPPAAFSIPAFPGAEGGGAKSVGGRGGAVRNVTSRDDEGPGSLRAACEAAGPRTIVCRVAGIITLTRSLEIRNPFITIARQTAPGGGILIRTNTAKYNAINIRTHD